MIRTVTIYCASSKKTPPPYLKAAEELAEELLAHNIGVRYGGGALGLMGRIADVFIKGSGRIKGIIPEFMVKVEWAHPDVKDMKIVHDMHERKQGLMEDTDAIIALPGGTGTLEELMEVLALKRLGKFLKPIIILNTNGFYNPLIEFFETMVQNHFLRPEHLNAYSVVNLPEQVIPAILNAPPWSEAAIKNAPV
ncbi:MAG: TIGR00730 family Rossman fold protein [Bacteroidales bacterium]|nr:TIGR00730 family Rossman fold protein [Bacteroidales bacterium]